MASLAQVAAFERVPSLVLYPERCKDFRPSYSGYVKRIWNANGMGICHETAKSWELASALREFLWDCPRALKVRAAFASKIPFPKFP